MATAAPIQKKPEPVNQAELESLGQDFFRLAEGQLAKMKPAQRERAIASIHATAQSLRAEK